ncbi:MAG TPA: hypothetical protein VNX88_22665 [Terriglobales bacterium]|jgi:hypothetical protein|nr:hypothetical protein [Terriglobales bacterium]
MPLPTAWNLLVFRDGRRVLDGRDLLRTLQRKLDGLLQISDFRLQSSREELIEALLRSGELECALADCDACDASTEALVRLTDQLAFALAGQSGPKLFPGMLESIAAAEVPERITASTPEGFCYYALHPLDYADLLDENAIHAPAVAVVGIRSIGTTLSAVVRAWFELHGIPAERITVRPTGHPFDRVLSLGQKHRQWIARGMQREASFLVVDEGPGLSGSSFLAVAEALAKAGVSQNRIILLPSSSPNPSSLFAPDAVNRWSCFRTISLKPTRRIPAQAAEDIGWGEWRKAVFASEHDWPGVWAWTERRKFLSADKRSMFRFDGHGHYGRAVRSRSQLLAEHGWGPEISAAGEGFSECPWIEGVRPKCADGDTVLRLARYCAFRAAHFEHPFPLSDALEQMTQVNLERALGVSQSVVLPIERPVLADARMMPHEWIATSGGRLIKVDAASHGDDHFYPGPTDIAWDLAGAIAEWKLDHEASDRLVREYQRISGDAIEARLPGYLIAYCAFRLGFTLSAAGSVSEASESGRLKREGGTYRQRLATLLPRATAA